jgi:RNA 3'-terminal phosphate cyclase
MAGGGSFRTLPLTRHATTNAEVIEGFLDVEVSIRKLAERVWEVAIAAPDA